MSKNELRDSRFSYQSQSTNQNIGNSDFHQFEKLKESARSNNLLEKQGRYENNNNFTQFIINQQGNREQFGRSIIQENNLSNRFAQGPNLIHNPHIQPSFYQMQSNNPQ
jgi:hypothetical protein